MKFVMSSKLLSKETLHQNMIIIKKSLMFPHLGAQWQTQSPPHLGTQWQTHWPPLEGTMTDSIIPTLKEHNDKITRHVLRERGSPILEICLYSEFTNKRLPHVTKIVNNENKLEDGQDLKHDLKHYFPRSMGHVYRNKWTPPIQSPY